MKKMFHIFFFLLFCSLLHGQTVWNTLVTDDFVGAPLDAVKRMIKTDDGGFLVLLRSHTLLKYNGDGDLIWEKEYNLFSNVDSITTVRSSNIIELSNNNIFYIGSYFTIASEDAFSYNLILNSNGDSLNLYTNENYSWGGILIT